MQTKKKAATGFGQKRDKKREQEEEDLKEKFKKRWKPYCSTKKEIEINQKDDIRQLQYRERTSE